LLQARGVVPSEIREPDCYAVRADAVLLPADESWFEGTTERRSMVHVRRAAD
jgi:hypothetical protein